MESTWNHSIHLVYSWFFIERLVSHHAIVICRGLPYWLHDIPGIVYRSDNEPFKVKSIEISKWNSLPDHPFIASWHRWLHHENGPPYVRWAAQMAVGLQTGVPWVMCKQDDAPDPVVSFLLSVYPHKTMQWTMHVKCKYIIVKNHSLIWNTDSYRQVQITQNSHFFYF